ncbi:A24 family peptidase [Candidatus Woesearchaeota archaeon]|nr:A24 family peptidase [Candidatus Woesearchaeota archaeon]
MITDIILLSLAFVALIIGTVTDIKTREVPDWLNFSIIFAGIGIRLIYSSMTFDWIYLLEGAAGLAAFVILGYLMFYAGQWGGGDSKLLMGLGALIGLNLSLQPNQLLIVFLFNVLLVGAVYGLIYSTTLAIIHREKFIKNFSKLMHSKQIQRFRRMRIIFLIMLILIIAYFLKGRLMDIFVLSTLTIMIILLYLSFYLVIFVKAVELSAMYRFITPEKLTEGDWIAKDVIVDKKKIVGPKDLGIEKKQIKQLIELKKQGKISKVKVKYGIPFVPSFLAAFILTLGLGAWWLILF